MVISQTPFRISLAGGGTDFYDYFKLDGGCVVSLTINKYIYVIIKERFDTQISVNSRVYNNVNEIENEYVREAALLTGLIDGFDISVMSDILSGGSGLGSSSSLAVGLINAFNTYLGNHKSLDEIYSSTIKLELDILKKPIGVQDQAAATYGGVNKFTFFEKYNIRRDKINLSNSTKRLLENNLLLLFTNITRKSEVILQEQTDNIKDKIIYLNSLKKLAEELYDKLQIANIDCIGEILNKSWVLKSRLATGISNNDIDIMCKRALGAGAIGCKIAGAGGGGFLLTYARPETHINIQKTLCNNPVFPFLIEPHGTKIIINYSRQELK